MTDSAVGNGVEGEYRIEHDTMGEVRVPAKALWRAQTQRAVENFPISFRGLDRNQIRAMALLKAACAQVNKDLGLLDPAKADAIIAAAAEIADGRHDDQFPMDLWRKMGSLGVLVEISLKVMPLPTAEATLVWQVSQAEALAQLHRWGGQPLPLNASCWVHDASGAAPGTGRDLLFVRLRGAVAAVESACRLMGGERQDNTDVAPDWTMCRDQRSPPRSSASTVLMKVVAAVSSRTSTIAAAMPSIRTSSNSCETP